MAKPMLSLGVPGLVYQIPMPQSGMGFNSEHDITKVATVHGGKSIVSSPTTHKSFTLSWKDWDDNLRALIDAHGGTIGNTAFWMQDPTADQNNLLPSRWSNAWQLGYIAGGWCKPVITVGSTGPQSRQVTFTQVNAGVAATKLFGVVRNRTLRLAGTAMYLSAVGGSRTLLAVPSISLGATTALAAPSPSLGAATPLASPTLNAPTASASGGSLAAATYYYQVVATNVAGQTLPSNEASVTTTGSNSSVALSWNQVNGASAYIVYRGTSAGGENVEVANPQGGTTTSYTDTGAVPVASPSFTPTSNTTGSGSFAAGTYYWKVTAVNGSGETTGSAELTATLGANGSQQITWPAIAGATKYNVYRGTATGAENTLAGSVTATAAATYSFQDTGTSNTAGTVPSSNTTPDGSFAAGTYYWKVTAVNQYGETPASNEVSVTLAVNGSQTIAWPAVPGATGYKVYRGTAAGAENVLLTTTNSTTYSYKDTGVAAPAGSPPSSDTGTGSGIIVRTFSSATNTWTQVGVYDPAALTTPVQVVAATDTTTTFVELDLFLPAGTKLVLGNLCLGTLNWTQDEGVIRRNLALNPCMEAASGTVNVRTNIIQNPLCSSGWSGRWFGGGTGTGTYTYPTGATAVSANGSYVRKTWTANDNNTNSDTGFHESNTALYSAVTPGQVVSFSAYLRPSVGDKVGQASLQFLQSDKATTVGSRYVGANTSMAANQWTRISQANVTVPAGAAYVQVIPDVGAAGAFWNSGDTLDLCGPLLEVSSVLGTYFDGSTAAVGDYTYAWSGTANASASYQQAPGVANWVGRWYGSSGGSGVMYLSKGTALNRQYVLRKLWKTANTSGALDTGFNTPSIAVVPGATYTSSISMRPTITASATTLCPYVIWQDASFATISSTPATGPSAPNGVWTRASTTVTAPSNAAYAQFVFGPYNGASTMAAGDYLDFDSALIEQSSTFGAYFDGSSQQFASYSPPQYVYWDAAAETSQSVIASQPKPAFPNGTGVGACQFDGALQGTLQFGGNPNTNWIGMAVNISEVERGDGVIRFG